MKKFDEKMIKDLYTLYCQIVTSLYNFAIAKELQIQNKLSWSAVAYYYSLLHIGRGLCFMGIGDFPIMHEKLRDLLKGKDLTTQNARLWKKRNQSINFQDLKRGLAEKTASDENEVECQLKNLGRLLSKVSMIRNMSNYEMYIIAHQVDHQLVTAILSDGLIKLEKHVRLQLSTLVDYYRKYIQNLENLKEEYIAFLQDKGSRKWALGYFEKTLKKQQISEPLINEVVKTTNPILGLSCELKQCPEKFYRPISVSEFEGKVGKMIKLKKSFEKLD